MNKGKMLPLNKLKVPSTSSGAGELSFRLRLTEGKFRLRLTEGKFRLRLTEGKNPSLGLCYNLK